MGSRCRKRINEVFIMSCKALFGTAFSFLIASVLSPLAQARVVTIPDKRCVDRGIQRVYDVTVDYRNYVNTPGATMAFDLALVKLPMLRMINSDTSKSSAPSDSVVRVVMQPSNLQNYSFYPRFYMRCTASFVSSTEFEHECKIMPKQLMKQQNGSVKIVYDQYGMQDFHSTLRVVENSPECKSGRTLLDYKLVMTSNDAEVTEIKHEVLKPAGPLKQQIGALFDEESFFKNYYINFYNGWAGTL